MTPSTLIATVFKSTTARAVLAAIAASAAFSGQANAVSHGGKHACASA